MRPCALGFALTACAAIAHAHAYLCRIGYAFTDGNAHQLYTKSNTDGNGHTNRHIHTKSNTDGNAYL